jgi:hypothetical protein
VCVRAAREKERAEKGIKTSDNKMKKKKKNSGQRFVGTIYGK